MLRKLCQGVLLLAMTVALSACGNGTTNSGGQQARASLKTSDLLATGYVIAGIDVTLSFPVGVTVKTDPVTGQVASGVVTITGVPNTSTTLVDAVYTPATASQRGSLRIMVANATGFSAPEYITVNLDISEGYQPTASEFSLSNFAASDLDGRTLPGLTPVMTAEIR